MPNFLNSTEIVPSCWAIGIGNSPPARKFAVSPEIAVRFGSAKVCSRPSSSSARSTLWTRLCPLVHCAPNPEVLPTVDLDLARRWAAGGTGRKLVPPSPVLFRNGARRPLPATLMGNGSSLSAAKAKLPELTSAFRSTPNCLTMLRSISTTETLSSTCSRPSTVSMLMTLLGPLGAAARATASAAARGVADRDGRPAATVRAARLFVELTEEACDDFGGARGIERGR